MPHITCRKCAGDYLSFGSPQKPCARVQGCLFPMRSFSHSNFVPALLSTSWAVAIRWGPRRHQIELACVQGWISKAAILWSTFLFGAAHLHLLVEMLMHEGLDIQAAILTVSSIWPPPPFQHTPTPAGPVCFAASGHASWLSLRPAKGCPPLVVNLVNEPICKFSRMRHSISTCLTHYKIWFLKLSQFLIAAQRMLRIRTKFRQVITCNAGLS